MFCGCCCWIIYQGSRLRHLQTIPIPIAVAVAAAAPAPPTQKTTIFALQPTLRAPWTVDPQLASPTTPADPLLEIELISNNKRKILPSHRQSALHVLYMCWVSMSHCAAHSHIPLTESPTSRLARGGGAGEPIRRRPEDVGVRVDARVRRSGVSDAHGYHQRNVADYALVVDQVVSSQHPSPRHPQPTEAVLFKASTPA
jgi:hypothetical protein